MNENMGSAPDLGQFSVAAVGLHEMYLAYVNAGFTKADAMQIICAVSRPTICVRCGTPVDR